MQNHSACVKESGNLKAAREQLQNMLFGKETQAGRCVYLDYLRLIATVFVICVHTISLAASMVPYKSSCFYVLEILDYTFLSCNLLFIMISGALLLPIRGEGIKTFFVKRFSKVALPLVVYYVLYVCAKEGMYWLTPAQWPEMLRRILIGAPEEAPHFWLIYVILGLYLLTPFLRLIMANIPDSVFAGVMAVIFVVNGLDTYAPLFGVELHFGLVVDSFAGVFLFGYFLAKKHSLRTEVLLITGGMLSFLLSCFWILKVGAYEDYIYQNAPTMMLFSAAVFLSVKRICIGTCREGRFLRLVGKYSFSILLIHWGVLHFLVKQVLKVNVLSGGIVGGCLLMIVLTLFFSIVGAVLIDNTLILLIRVMFRKIAEFFRIF